MVKDNWIKSDTALPEIGTTVLGYIDGVEVEPFILTKLNEHGLFEDDMNMGIYYRITHWQRLFKPTEV